MRWKLALIIGCVLAGDMAAAPNFAQETPAPAAAGAATDLAPEPRSLRELTRILRSADRADELAGALSELEAMVSAGNADAALLLGTEYSKDRGSLAVDCGKAVSYLEQAVALGLPEANLTLYDLHRRQAGDLPRDKALDYLRAAADAGLAGAMRPLADALRRGTYGEPDLAGAITWYEASLAAGDTSAAAQLAAIYKAGTGAADDGAMQAKYLGISADAGDVSARRALADLYLKGNVIPQDLALAEQNLRAAFEAGDESAGVVLASALLRGRLGAGREAEGVALLQSAFDGGNTATAAALADAYTRGRGTTADPLKALDILRVGVNDDDPDARSALFNLYVRGAGRALAPDLTAARGLFADIPQEERSGAVAANGAILEAYGTGLDDFARMWSLFEGLDTPLQVRTGQQLLRVNKNAYVYMLQELMAERGHYTGSMSGQLGSSTIAAINRFCADNDIVGQCRLGPLAPSTWDAISGHLGG